jgi:signal transduction histidine kinase
VVRKVRCENTTSRFSDSHISTIKFGAMSAPILRQTRVLNDASASIPPTGRDVSLPQLAHELNSLLDGSIRSLGLAERALDENAPAPAAGLSEALGRLRIAREALSSMAELLDRTLAAGSASDVGIFTRQESLGAVAGRLVRTVLPLAGEHDVDLAAKISPSAESTPALTLEPVILNGLRNAIRSASRGEKPREVRLEIHMDAERVLQMAIVDSGSGLPDGFAIGASGEPNGHGIGLELSQRIVVDLGGLLTLESPTTGGAILRVTIPMARLERP